MTDLAARLVGATAGGVLIAFWTFMLPVLPLGALALLFGAPLAVVAPVAGVVCVVRGFVAAVRGWTADDY